MTSHAHHVGTAAPSVWDTPWPHALVVVAALLVVGVPWLYRALEPPDALRGYRGRHRRVGGPFLDREPVPEREVVVLPAMVDLPIGPPPVEHEWAGPRHYVGWPAREVRQIGEHTGEWAIDDLADAMYDVELLEVSR